MKIYLDDIRMPYDSSWTLARHGTEFKTLITSEFEPITEISFDHDLGENESSGYDLTKWFVEYAMDHPKITENLERVIIHSDNTPGRENIAGYFESAKAHGVFNNDLDVIRAPAMLTHSNK